MSAAAMNRAIFRAFKLRGLSIKADAVQALISGKGLDRFTFLSTPLLTYFTSAYGPAVLSRENDADAAMEAILDAIKVSQSRSS